MRLCLDFQLGMAVAVQHGCGVPNTHQASFGGVFDFEPSATDLSGTGMVRNSSVACISRRLLTEREEMANLRGRVLQIFKSQL